MSELDGIQTGESNPWRGMRAEAGRLGLLSWSDFGSEDGPTQRACAAWWHAMVEDDEASWLVAADACEEGGFAESAAVARNHATRCATAQRAGDEG